MRRQIWMYVLSRIRQPSRPYDAEQEEVWKPRGFDSIGVRLVDTRIVLSGPASRNSPWVRNCFGFVLRGGELDDAFAQRFADAEMASSSLVWGVTLGDSPRACRVPLTGRRQPVTVRFATLAKIGMEIEQEVDWSTFERNWQVPASSIPPVWRILPVVIRDPFFDATHYYAASLREFSLFGDAETIADDPSAPVSRKDAVQVESAVQDAFKAVEALVGDPPASDQRLARKLSEIGVDPDEQVGFDRFGNGSHPETVISKIRKMKLARDKRVAHGSTPKPRTVTYYELMDFQECAGFIVSAAVKREIANMGGQPPIVAATRWFEQEGATRDS